MVPCPDERGNPHLYRYRMLVELRAMALGRDRPRPHVPQGQRPEWQIRKERATRVKDETPTPDANARTFAEPVKPVVPPTHPELDNMPTWVTEDMQ